MYHCYNGRKENLLNREGLASKKRHAGGNDSTALKISEQKFDQTKTVSTLPTSPRKADSRMHYGFGDWAQPERGIILSRS